ncbi:hypothetical protein CK203_016540 [Vitis vinifera]|uniref:RNase H type-1 domain-containing protein n=1 Tax=Vitis vinifera TaxID=29760 RepID=A0A438J125_VITVI|nr:hypothetical protein CK203_016540 [Vitis vinifera]
MGNQRRSIPLPLTQGAEPIYYVSRALADVETRYSKMELTALALRSAAQSSALFPSPPSDRNIPEDPANTTNQVNKNGGLCELTEPHAHQALDWAPTTVPNGEHLEQAIRLGFSASNNEAEYEAILSGLDLALALSVSKLRIFSDSQLVVKHVQEEYEAKDARMARYLAKVKTPCSNSPNGQSKKSSELTIGALTLWPA